MIYLTLICNVILSLGIVAANTVFAIRHPISPAKRARKARLIPTQTDETPAPNQINQL